MDLLVKRERLSKSSVTSKNKGTDPSSTRRFTTTTQMGQGIPKIVSLFDDLQSIVGDADKHELRSLDPDYEDDELDKLDDDEKEAALRRFACFLIAFNKVRWPSHSQARNHKSFKELCRLIPNLQTKLDKDDSEDLMDFFRQVSSTTKMNLVANEVITAPKRCKWRTWWWYLPSPTYCWWLAQQTPPKAPTLIWPRWSLKSMYSTWHDRFLTLPHWIWLGRWRACIQFIFLRLLLTISIPLLGSEQNLEQLKKGLTSPQATLSVASIPIARVIQLISRRVSSKVTGFWRLVISLIFRTWNLTVL